MSHATVTVRLPDIAESRIEDALAEIMEPFNEQPDEGSPHLVFNDAEDEYRKEYETDGTETVIMPDGSFKSPYDAEFKTRKPGASIWDRDEYIVPAHLTKREVPHRERYATIEEFAKAWHSATRDVKHNRFGHYSNPNAKWDWYVVGGRWSGFFPLKPGAKRRLGRPGTFDNKTESGHGDIVRVDDIDMDAVAMTHRQRLDTFIAEYRDLLDGKKFDAFDGPRSQAMEVGLLRVIQGPHSATDGEHVIPWAGLVREDDNRKDWNDVAVAITDEHIARISPAFNPLKSFAALDADGWHEPGKMGWWGCSSDTPDTYMDFARSFQDRFIKSARSTDWLVLVDYHI